MMLRSSVVLVALGALSSASCASPDGGPRPGDPAPLPAPAASTTRASAKNELTFTTPAFDAAPGDSFECFYTDVITDRELSVNSSFGQQGVGGHHIVVYYTDERQPVGHHACVDAEMARLHQVAGTAGKDGTAGEGAIALPEGYAIKVPRGKQIVTQSHYINATGRTENVRDTVTVELLDPSEVKAYANALVLVDQQFVLKPRDRHTRTTSCTLTRDYDILLLLGHMHEWGASFKIETVDAKDHPITTLYEKEWAPVYTSHPPVSRFPPEAPLKLAKGTRVRQTCTWNNTTDETLKFPREMCVTFAYYIPDQGFDICALDDIKEEE